MSHQPRFGLRHLLVGVGVATVCVMMLARPNEWWWSVAFTSKLFLLASAVPLAAYYRGGPRTFWLAFAIAGSLFHLAGNDVLRGVGIPAEGLVLVQIARSIPESWTSRNDWFYLVASELGALVMAGLVGLFCLWMVRREQDQEQAEH